MATSYNELRGQAEKLRAQIHEGPRGTSVTVEAVCEPKTMCSVRVDRCVAEDSDNGRNLTLVELRHDGGQFGIVEPIDGVTYVCACGFEADHLADLLELAARAVRKAASFDGVDLRVPDDAAPCLAQPR